jgi:hypothetical protein
MSLLWATAVFDPYSLYHGSNAALPDGASLKSLLDHGSGPHYTEAPEQEWRAGRVWASDNPYDASHWGKHVYEVHLQDSRRHDAHEYDWDRTDFGNPDGQWHGSAGHVVRRLDPDEIKEPS